MPTSRRPTNLRQKDIARLAGVSAATVSLALAHHARIPAETRSRIEALATRHGYRLDQAARTLQSRRQRRGHRESVGVITHFPEDWGAQPKRWALGLTAHLDQLGYGLDVFRHPTTPAAWRTLSRSLLARGIRGVLLHCRNDDPYHYPLPWERLATVAWSGAVTTSFSPNLAAAHFEDNFRVAQIISNRGYRQPALIRFGPDLPALTGGLLAGFSAHLPKAQVRIWENNRWTPEGLLRWIRENGVDVLCGTLVPSFLANLLQAGIRVPEDIAICSADVDTQRADDSSPGPRGPRLSGLKQARLRGYRLCADLLHARLCRNDYGRSADGVHITLRGTWQEGDTLPSLITPPVKPL